MKTFGMVTTSASARYTMPALESFFHRTPLADEDQFFLVDNDNSWSESNTSFGGKVQVLKNKAPLGFAANANQIITRAVAAGADLYFLNNDLIFSAGWIDALAESGDTIASPLSPREIHYAASVFNLNNQQSAGSLILSNPSELSAYLELPEAYELIAAVHRKNSQGYWNLLVVPFFAIRIPIAVLQAVGKFDEDYGLGGGEDYDYCLRAILAGYKIAFALPSFLLHFGGKSSWSGAEDAEHRSAREKKFMDHFEQKWGDKLFKLVLNEDGRVLVDGTTSTTMEQIANAQGIVHELLEGRSVKIHI